MIEHKYNYFNRDISWLSFNYRVLLEAADETLPLSERINFISIYSSNLEEFYKIRVAEHKSCLSDNSVDTETREQTQFILQQITEEVNRQIEDRIDIYENKILPALKKERIIFYQTPQVEEFHKSYISNFFKEEIFPYLQPVPVHKDEIYTFLRDNRLYLAVRLIRKDPCISQGEFSYFILKLPYSKVSRFIELPEKDNNHYIIFMEDIIKANIGYLFPGYKVDSSHCFKISRDADILIDDIEPGDIVEKIRKKVKRRKIGAVCRFVYERQMSSDFLSFLATAFTIHPDEFVPGDKHLNLEDLRHLPNPSKLNTFSIEKPQPMRLKGLDKKESIFNYIAEKDLLIHFPYHSFEHTIHLLYEAVHDPAVTEIMITQYRVAENSRIINTLIAAAQNGKKVTVFVELKARFDEENNLVTAEMMKQAGIHIIYSIPHLKVHAKVALILRRTAKGKIQRSYAYISTGNFNEKTAGLYADSALFTCNPDIIADLHNLFMVLQQEKKSLEPKFKHLLVSQFNLIPELKERIQNEIDLVNQGKRGRIVLKMNALQDHAMIDELYRASEAGVKIDLIVRGICCLIPGQPYSKNIRVTRIVDLFLEHARIWYFGNDDDSKIYLGSPDWMRRNLYRRIEAVTPILDEDLKNEIIEMLFIQLRDNQKASWIDKDLKNIFKYEKNRKPVRAQYEFYNYLNNSRKSKSKKKKNFVTFL